LSDYLGKRKGLAVFGYALGALTKPLFAVGSSVGVVATARLVASGLAGLLWDELGAAFTFYVGAAFCVLALVVMAFRHRGLRRLI
jgi:predicted MFS family arabinose efflux permease